MNVRLLAPAQVELDEAVVCHASQAPGLGDGFFWKCFAASIHPAPLNRMSSTHTTIRHCRLQRFPYSLIYPVETAGVLTLMVVHQHR